jgi:hypothetical protein
MSVLAPLISHVPLVAAFDQDPLSACACDLLNLLLEDGKGSILERCRAAAWADSYADEITRFG